MGIAFLGHFYHHLPHCPQNLLASLRKKARDSVTTINSCTRRRLVYSFLTLITRCRLYRVMSASTVIQGLEPNAPASLRDQSPPADSVGDASRALNTSENSVLLKVLRDLGATMKRLEDRILANHDASSAGKQARGKKSRAGSVQGSCSSQRP
jgi:hypothetical protein